MNRKAKGHATNFKISGTTSGVMVAPTDEPAFTTPMPTARSLRGNHSLTVLAQPGQQPDSPMPSAKRARQNPITVLTRLWLAAAIAHIPTTSARPARVPSRSMMRLTVIRPMA